MAAEDLVDFEVLSAVVKRLIVRGGLIGGTRAAETWTLAAKQGMTPRERWRTCSAGHGGRLDAGSVSPRVAAR
jgi:hypothetical protein